MRIFTKKIRKGLILPVFGVLALFAVSCNNLSEMPEEKSPVVFDEANTSVLKISLGEKNVRTALPAVAEDGSSFTSFKLYGKNLSQNAENWSQLGEEWTSLSAMQGASVAITKENWAFKLEAEVGGLKYADDTTNASVNVTEDMTNLSFNLQKQDTLGTLSGGGTLNVTVNYQDADTHNKVEKVTVIVQNSDGTEVVAESETNLTISDSTATYSNTSLEAGQYKLIFKFYAKASDADDAAATVLLGSCTERALVTGGLTSSSTITLTSFDAVKSVKYVKDYTVENGDVTINESETVYYSRQSPLTAFIANPTKTGKGFGGWYTEENGGGTAVTAIGQIESLSEPKTLYAKWLDGFYVTFNANGGSGTMETQLISPGNALPPNVFTRTNYKFLGWATSAGGAKVYDDGASITIESDTTLYAVWDIRFRASKNDVQTGDIAVQNGSNIKYAPYAKWNSSEYQSWSGKTWTVIGVCVNTSIMISLTQKRDTWTNANNTYPYSTTNWRMPSYDELVTIYNTRGTLNTSLGKVSGSQLILDAYWASESNKNNGWVFDFVRDYIPKDECQDLKSETHAVRTVRNLN